MTLMILAGVWALAFGHLSVTNSLKLKGNEARIFGAILIAVASFGFPHISGYFSHFMPRLVAGNDGLRTAYDLMVGAFGIYATGYVMTQVIPKLRIPTVTVSLKRQRA